MKTVFENAMVAHVWANQSQGHARSHNGNMSFDGNVLLSYRTPIATLLDDVNGRRVALVTSERFSMTTSCKHMPAVYRALDYGRFIPMYCVPFVREGYGREMHPANLAALEKGYRDAVQSLARGREWYDYRAELVTSAADTVRGYASAFGLQVPELDPEGDIAAARARFDALEAKRNDPAYQAKRERERERREARELAKFAAHLEEWRQGGSLYGIPWKKQRGLPVMLRVSGDEVETSRGARVPVAHAKRLWAAIKRCREAGEAWQSNGHTMPVGVFRVDRIEADGTLKAGCHVIAFAELARMAVTLGLEVSQ